MPSFNAAQDLAEYCCTQHTAKILNTHRMDVMIAHLIYNSQVKSVMI